MSREKWSTTSRFFPSRSVIQHNIMKLVFPPSGVWLSNVILFSLLITTLIKTFKSFKLIKFCPFPPFISSSIIWPIIEIHFWTLLQTIHQNDTIIKSYFSLCLCHFKMLTFILFRAVVVYVITHTHDQQNKLPHFQINYCVSFESR